MRIVIEFDPTTAQARITGAALPETEATLPGTTVPVAATAPIDAGACSALPPSDAPLTQIAGVSQRPASPAGSPPPPHRDTFGLVDDNGIEQAVDAGPFRL